MKIAILGAGNVGCRLYSLLNMSEHTIWLCGRTATGDVHSIEDGVQFADMVFLTVPYTALHDMLPALKNKLTNKIVVDCTNPLNTDWSPLLLGQENSAAEEVARLLPNSYIVKAFNTIFADVMTADKQVRNGLKITAFIAGNHADAKKAVSELAKVAGFNPLDVGGLQIARYLEAMAHLNIQIAVNMAGRTNAAFVYHQSS